ncbi:MAG TPA: hypothetical protein VK631_16695 [Solirubrobacteraceae bacterium]|nr:hypothetical protein [Solirubrobacteraceae bacterium]
MGDERITSTGWLPPVAPGAGPRPRFDAPAPAPPAHVAPAPAPPPAAPDRGARNTPAVWSLVLSIAALALLLTSLGTLFILTLPCSAAAWVLARRARGRLERGESTWGESQATAALWMARIGVIAGVVAAIVFVSLLASGFDFEQFRDDLQRELDDRRDRPGNGVRSTLEGLRAVVGR